MKNDETVKRGKEKQLLSARLIPTLVYIPVFKLRLKDCVSNQVVSSTRAPQWTILSPILFTRPPQTSSLSQRPVICRNSQMTLQLSGVSELIYIK